MLSKFTNQVIEQINEAEDVGYKIKRVVVSKFIYDALEDEGFDFKIKRATSVGDKKYELPNIDVVLDDDLLNLFSLETDDDEE